MKKIAVVVGLGISGFGAALLLHKKGWKVRVTDEKGNHEVKQRVKDLNKRCPGIEFEIGSHSRELLRDAELVVTSPGVMDSSRPLTRARESNIPIIDEIELGFRYCPGRIVAVTGTNGKSTTTTLIGGVLKAGGYDTCVCGNIGYSFCERVLNFNKETVAVLEVSSFQLQRVKRFRPFVSLFLNITQNHFDRHKDFKEYFEAKTNIFENQKKSDWAIVNYENKYLRRLEKHISPKVLYFSGPASRPGSCVKNGAIYANCKQVPKKPVCAVDSLALKGEHNLKNSQAAALVGLIFKIKRDKIQKALESFKGLEHRFEYVCDYKGVTFINDSKATTVDAAICAIRSLKRPVVLIAGGKDKGSDFTVLRTLISRKVKRIVLIGQATEKIKTQLMGTVPSYKARDLSSAVSLSYELAKRGDVVLLSPMCASFDMFKNFEERGERFKESVTELCRAR